MITTKDFSDLLKINTVFRNACCMAEAVDADSMQYKPALAAATTAAGVFAAKVAELYAKLDVSASPVQEDQERALFEAEVTAKHGITRFGRNDRGEYHYRECESWWQGWLMCHRSHRDRMSR